MGKAQYKKKTAAKRHNPIRVPDAHLGAGRIDGKVDSEKEKQMIPVMAKVRPVLFFFAPCAVPC